MLCCQAVATGGTFMFAQDALQLISMFGNLGKLLDLSAKYYQMVGYPSLWQTDTCAVYFRLLMDFVTKKV